MDQVDMAIYFPLILNEYTIYTAQKKNSRLQKKSVTENFIFVQL